MFENVKPNSQKWFNLEDLLNEEWKDIKEICENIMKVREKINDDTWGANTLEKIMSGKCTSVDLMEIDLKVKNKMEKVGL